MSGVIVCTLQVDEDNYLMITVLHYNYFLHKYFQLKLHHNKRISVKIFLRLISPPCTHSWPLFLLTKTYKGSLYLLVTLEKSLDIIFALFFLLESSKLCPVSKLPFCFPWPHPFYVGEWRTLLRHFISPHI